MTTPVNTFKSNVTIGAEGDTGSTLTVHGSIIADHLTVTEGTNFDEIDSITVKEDINLQGDLNFVGEDFEAATESAAATGINAFIRYVAAVEASGDVEADAAHLSIKLGGEGAAAEIKLYANGITLVGKVTATADLVLAGVVDQGETDTTT